MRSLLSKSLWQFVVCVAVVFVLSAPLFYLLTRCFYAEDILDIIEAVERGEGIPPLDFERDVVAGMMLQFLLIFVVVCVALFITMRFMTRRLWLPFDDTLRKVEQFNLTRDELPAFGETDVYEFARLNSSLERLMRRNMDVFRIQKEFTENASHELQTPLAVFRGRLDLLMQEKLSERQMELVAELYDLTMRMGRLNRNLLLLARIDNAQYVSSEMVDVGELLAEGRQMYGVLREDVELSVEVCDGGCVVCGDRVLLDCLLKNLVVNAIRYTESGGVVRVVVESGGLSVANRSEDGVALDEGSLFRRFGGGAVRRCGTGLGLAIVKAVCDLHGWRVGYVFDGGEHRFWVRFRGD